MKWGPIGDRSFNISGNVVLNYRRYVYQMNRLKYSTIHGTVLTVSIHRTGHNTAVILRSCILVLDCARQIYEAMKLTLILETSNFPPDAHGILTGQWNFRTTPNLFTPSFIFKQDVHTEFMQFLKFINSLAERIEFVQYWYLSSCLTCITSDTKIYISTYLSGIRVVSNIDHLEFFLFDMCWNIWWYSAWYKSANTLVEQYLHSQ